MQYSCFLFFYTWWVVESFFSFQPTTAAAEVGAGEELLERLDHLESRCKELEEVFKDMEINSLFLDFSVLFEMFSLDDCLVICLTKGRSKYVVSPYIKWIVR